MHVYCTTEAVHIFRLPHNADLALELQRLVREHDVKLGRVSVIGAVQQAAVGFYDQQERIYRTITFDHELEILHCVGNVSLRDDQPVVHAHVTFADSRGNAFGGHLVEGCRIFAAEAEIIAYTGTAPQRALDAQTGLPLWGGTLV